MKWRKHNCATDFIVLSEFGQSKLTRVFLLSEWHRGGQSRCHRCRLCVQCSCSENLWILNIYLLSLIKINCHCFIPTGSCASLKAKFYQSIILGNVPCLPITGVHVSALLTCNRVGQVCLRDAVQGTSQRFWQAHLGFSCCHTNDVGG